MHVIISADLSQGTIDQIKNMSSGDKKLEMEKIFNWNQCAVFRVPEPGYEFSLDENKDPVAADHDLNINENINLKWYGDGSIQQVKVSKDETDIFKSLCLGSGSLLLKMPERVLK